MTLSSKIGSTLLVFAFLFTALPAQASTSFQIAESRNSNRLSADQDSKDVQYTGSLRKQTRALPKKRVENVPIPILYGVTHSDIVSDFGAPRDGGARTHQGQDIFAPRGTPIVSPTHAVVTKTGKGSTAGIYVYTANPGGEAFNYMHLDKLAKGIKKGKVLKPGDLIGYVGNTGNAKYTPSHLHFEIRKGRKALDPYPRLTGTFTEKEKIAMLNVLIETLTKDVSKK